MGDMLQSGTTWLEGQRDAHLSHDVTYSRGADEVTLSATVGRSDFETHTEFGIETAEARDYLVLAADLVLAGSAVEPVRGDQITETIGGVEHVFEVRAPGGAPPWRWSDQNRLTMRIHTKYVGEAP